MEKSPASVWMPGSDRLRGRSSLDTGTPVPGGLSFPEACALVAAVARSGRRIVGLDLVEVVPGPDGDEWDGNVAARLLYKMIGHALRTSRNA